MKVSTDDSEKLPTGLNDQLLGFEFNPALSHYQQPPSLNKKYNVGFSGYGGVREGSAPVVLRVGRPAEHPCVAGRWLPTLQGLQRRVASPAAIAIVGASSILLQYRKGSSLSIG